MAQAPTAAIVSDVRLKSLVSERNPFIDRTYRTTTGCTARIKRGPGSHAFNRTKDGVSLLTHVIDGTGLHETARRVRMGDVLAFLIGVP